ncbi:MAG: phosphoribosylanthranilate isomerase [Fimbriimonadaceae bacterium]|nr:phosphoribosylanthranilate isomerase [Fimbriimonadaceae bacterium]
MTLVKICGLTRREDALAAANFGADALGFVFERTSPRFIGDEDPRWMADLPPFVMKVAVFGRVDRMPPKTYIDLVQGVEWDVFPEPAPKRLHVIRLRAGQTAGDFVNQTVNAAALVLDAYRDEAFGGTGHQVDWDLAAEIVARSARPVVLAGGLTPDNVAEAVRRVRPYAVDVSSGIERRPGEKDLKMLGTFIEAAKSA